MRDQVQLITYADRLAGDLPGLARLLDGRLAGVFGGVHLLPVFTPFDGGDAARSVRTARSVAELTGVS